MRLNRIDICSSIDFELTGFTAPFAFFSLGISLKAVFSCIIHRVFYQISIAKLDLGRATATVSLHVDLHNPNQCLYHSPPSHSLSLFLDQTEYKNNLEIEKIQLNIKSVANCGKTRMVNLHKYFQFKEKWSRAIQSYWPTQSSTDFDQSSTNWIKSNGFW